MGGKTDVRILKTKGKFRRALLDLLAVKGIGQISVCEICQKAGVNRNTFYAHYTSAEDLMKEVEESFTRGFRAGGQLALEMLSRYSS